MQKMIQFRNAYIFKATLYRKKRETRIYIINQSLKIPAHQSLQNVYPNLDIAPRILLCIPLRNCSNERSFSCLKIVKNYQRSSLSQDKLNSLALLCIEFELRKTIKCITIQYVILLITNYTYYKFLILCFFITFQTILLISQHMFQSYVYRYLHELKVIILEKQGRRKISASQ